MITSRCNACAEGTGPCVAARRALRELLATTLAELCGPLDEGTLDDLEGRAERISLRRGEAPFMQGDAADAWYVVASGRLSVVARDAAGNETTIGELGRGESLGEIALLGGTARSATPYAVRDTELLRFSAAHFDEIMERHPRVLRAISRSLARRSLGIREGAASARPSPCVNIAVVPARPGVNVAPFVRRLVESLGRSGATLHAGSASADRMGLARVAKLPDEDPHWRRLAAWLDERAVEARFVVLEGDAAATPWTKRVLREADHVLIVADAAHDPAPHALERELFGGPAARHAQRTLVLLHKPETALPSGTARWLDARDVQHHQHVRIDRAGDVERVARTLAGTSIGLVLGAGGARGFAHIGTLQALAEQRIPIDHVGGTSVGALVGAMHAMGRSPEEIMGFGRQITAMRPFAELGLPIASLVRGQRLERIMALAFGGAAIEDLWIPFFCTSCDISRFRDVVHDRGDLVSAALASSALPGVLPPRVRDGRLLVDGGTTDMLPGELMRKRCTGPLIAVDVSAERELEPIDRFPTSWSALWHRLRPGARRMPTANEVFWRAVAFGVARRTAAVALDADVFLRPPVERYGTTELGAMEQIARLGYEHARERLSAAKLIGTFAPPEVRSEASPSIEAR